jgi:hypothetical protein
VVLAQQVVVAIVGAAGGKRSRSQAQTARALLQDIPQTIQRASYLTLAEMKQQGAAPAQADLAAGAEKAADTACVIAVGNGYVPGGHGRRFSSVFLLQLGRNKLKIVYGAYLFTVN